LRIIGKLRYDITEPQQSAVHETKPHSFSNAASVPLLLLHRRPSLTGRGKYHFRRRLLSAGFPFLPSRLTCENANTKSQSERHDLNENAGAPVPRLPCERQMAVTGFY